MKIKFLIVFFMILLFPYTTWGQVVATIIDSHDDAEEDITGPNAGDVRRTSSDLEIDNENGIEQWVGLRFQHIDIPVGSTITSATIQFTASETDVGSLIVPIYGELSPWSVQFSDIDTLTGRPLTTGFLDWTIAPWFVGDSGPNTTTPDLSTIVQEIIDQPGWSEGNPVTFLIQNNAMETSERLAVSWDGNPLQAAVLTVDYDAPAVATADSVTARLGTNIAGQLSDVDQSDDVYLKYLRGNPFSPFFPSIWLEFEGTLTNDNPSTLAVVLEGQVNDVGIVQRIEMYNFNTGSFEVVDTRDSTRNEDSSAEVTLQGDITRFVEAGTGAVKTKVTYTSGGMGLGLAWIACIDKFVWHFGN